MKDAIIVLLIVLIAAASIYYLYKAKKRGETCVGCPYAKECSGKCNGKTPK